MSHSRRRLAAIMFTDMVGYTALGQRNEALSLAVLEEQRRLVRPILAPHQGREVKTIGDGFLVVFPSALEAVRCAYDIQRTVRGANLKRPEARSIHLRIGIHLGDIVEEKGDISGDAVNVASRIESFSRDGGVCITRQVHDQIQGKVDMVFSNLGKRDLKNVGTPIELFTMVMPWDGSAESSARNPQDARRIAILPFANISPSAEDAYFADGLTEELISTVSQLPGLQVIARTSVLPYRDGKKGIAEIGRELEVGSVLEGSVRKSSDRVKVSTQLIEPSTQTRVWGTSYEMKLDDIFSIQGDIARKVAEALKIKILSGDDSKLGRASTKDSEAYVLYLKGRYFVNERTHEGFVKGLSYLQRAVDKDPEFALAYSGLADCYHLMENWGYMLPTEAWPKSDECATKALELDNSLPEAHISRAMALAIASWNWRGAEEEYEEALRINPNYMTAHHWYAVHFLLARRRLDDAVKEMQLALKLDPFSPIIVTNMGRALSLVGRTAEATGHYEQALELNPSFAYANVLLGEVLIQEGRLEEGLREMKEAVTKSPDFYMARAALGYAYSEVGRAADARGVLEDLESKAAAGYVPATWMGVAAAASGDMDKAFGWLSRAASDRCSTFPEYYNEPVFTKLVQDSRFAGIIGRMNLGADP